MLQTNEKKKIPRTILNNLKNHTIHENEQQDDSSTISSGEDDGAERQNLKETLSRQHNNGDSTSNKTRDPVPLVPDKPSISDSKMPFQCNEEETLSEVGNDEAEWNQWYRELLGFEKEYGHVDVPDSYPENEPLSKWVKRQRHIYAALKDGQARTITHQERILKLEALGFNWRPGYIGQPRKTSSFFTEKWKLRYKELLEFGKKNGHVNVPHTYPENNQLARWVKRQRIQYKMFKEGKLPLLNLSLNQARIERLEMVGFVWDSHELTWRDHLEQLKVFRAQYGHCNVSRGDKDNKELAGWVKSQRRQYTLFQEGRRSGIDSKRIELLNEIGFEWRVRKEKSNIDHNFTIVV